MCIFSPVFTAVFASCWNWRFVVSSTCLDGDKHKATKGGQRAEQTPVWQCFHEVSRGIRFQQTLSEKCSLQNKQRMIFFFPFLGSFFPCARLETHFLCQKIWILLSSTSLMRSACFTGYTLSQFVEYKVEKKMTEGVTHRDTPVSSISSWSLGAWAALHGKGGTESIRQQQRTDSKSPKILNHAESSAGLKWGYHALIFQTRDFFCFCFSSRHLSFDTSPRAHVSLHGVILN